MREKRRTRSLLEIRNRSRMIRQGSFASQKAEPPYLSQNAGNEKAEIQDIKGKTEMIF
ncbi:hypothetical protein CL3_07940 [butyrate-producing bacterium SM4/1]|nr:hypothetical protein CLS_11000 [[Clostridium] cf. saccharolyticum K10]CBL35812.1 hypothetical protein CL3_07940 [butyrate-producing bacterium SM4/1]